MGIFGGYSETKIKPSKSHQRYTAKPSFTSRIAFHLTTSLYISAQNGSVKIQHGI